MENLKNIYDRVSHILEKHAQLNKEAMAILQALGYQGAKRQHRYNSKAFHYLQAKLANILANVERKKLDMQSMNLNYSPISLKEHLQKWIEELQYGLKALGELNKEHFQEMGMTSCIIEEAMCLMLDDLGNTQREYYEGEMTEWLEHHMLMIDKRKHKKFKHKEEEHKYE